MISYDDIKSGKAVMPVAVAAVAKEIGTLPALVKAAAAKLASATTAAEVLDAKDAAALVYDASKRAARAAKAKKAHDDLIAAAHRVQADALEIEAAAKRRLADEYDGGQERGEIVGAHEGARKRVPEQNAIFGAHEGARKRVPEQNAISPATSAEIGLTRKEVHEARRVRNAEQAQPGVVREALDKALDEGKEPSRAVVNEAITEALGEEKPKPRQRNLFDELVALWKEADPGVRQDFKAYIKGSEFVAKINHSVPASSQATEQTGAVPVLPAAPVAPTITPAHVPGHSLDREPVANEPAPGALAGACDITRSNTIGRTPPAPISKEPKLNPNCQKAARGEACFLSHSAASCSKCASVATRARASA